MGERDEQNQNPEPSGPSGSSGLSGSSVSAGLAGSSSNEDISSLRQQRSTAKGNITRIKNYLDTYGAQKSLIDLECRLDILNSYIKQIMAYQTEIERVNPLDDRRFEIEELCIDTRSKLLALLGTHRRSDPPVQETSISMLPIHRLPNLKLPNFDGKYSEYKNFISSFNTLIHNEPKLSRIEKFNHLLACLSGDALRTVKAFQVTEDNYQKALNRLAQRYDNKCLIFFDNIEQIFDIPKMSKPNASSLLKAVDSVSAIYDSLSSLGTQEEITSALLIHIVLSKTDNITKAKWNDQLDYSKLPTWEGCSKFLIRRCQTLEVNEDKASTQENSSNANKTNHKGKAGKNVSSLTCAQDKEKSKCAYCNSIEHQIYYCNSFNSLPVNQRFVFVKSNGLCINCLKKGHSVAACKSSKCRTCKGSHNSLLHMVSNNNNQNSNNNVEPTVAAPSSLHAKSSENIVFLATALINIKDKFGKFRVARAMLDSGSQINFMTEECANKLKVNRADASLKICGIGEISTTVKHQTSTVIQSRINNQEFSVNFHIIKSISNVQPEVNISTSDWKIPSNIILADPQFHKRQKVDILLGADIFFELLCVGQIKLGNSMPVLQKTLLGWIVSGRMTLSDNNVSNACYIVQQDDHITNIDKTLQQFVQIDSIPDNQPKLSEEHQICEKHFQDNTKLLDSGRFQVRLPFKIDPSQLGKSFDIAKRRFLALERRLEKTPEIKQQYNEFMSEYLQLQHMSPVDMSILNSSHYVIPHQVVLRPDSTTTKLRVVFDASAKTSSQISLNDTLLSGPTIQSELYTTLLKFRLNKFAITADITKMYRQVLVHHDDRKYQLVLWRKGNNAELQLYQLNTVTYGTSSAPFLAIRCLVEVAKRNIETFPIGAKVIENQFYVDDILSGEETLEELQTIRSQVESVLNLAGFALTKWYTNHKFYDQDLQGEKTLDNCNEQDATKTLGLKWCPSDDTFKFQPIKELIESQATKRNILSTTARLFDPLGLVCPLTTKAKILLQELWLSKVDWDESISQSLHLEWRSIQANLQQITSISIPRFINTTSDNKVEIHGFSDASMRAYGCCIYVVAEKNHIRRAILLTAKSKVAPVKTKTLPRLELCAAHLLCKLWHQIEPVISHFVKKIVFWTDSELVLRWLKMHASTLNTFVGNRVAEIQEYSTNVVWRHVPTKQNPADLASRGSTVEELISSDWFQGPKFLTKSEESWPVNPHFNVDATDELLERRKTKFIVGISQIYNNILIELINKYSSYTKLIRIVASHQKIKTNLSI